VHSSKEGRSSTLLIQKALTSTKRRGLDSLSNKALTLNAAWASDATRAGEPQLKHCL
jgi:hypothetical protein